MSKLKNSTQYRPLAKSPDFTPTLTQSSSIECGYWRCNSIHATLYCNFTNLKIINQSKLKTPLEGLLNPIYGSSITDCLWTSYSIQHDIFTDLRFTTYFVWLYWSLTYKGFGQKKFVKICTEIYFLQIFYFQP